MKFYLLLVLPLFAGLTFASESCFKYYTSEIRVQRNSIPNLDIKQTEPEKPTLSFAAFSNALRSAPDSFKDYELNQFIESSLFSLKQEYARILGQLAKEGSENQLGSMLKIVDSLSSTTEKIIQTTKAALEKEKSDSEKLNKMASELKACFSKISSCHGTVDNVILSTNNYLSTAKKFKNLIQSHIQLLEEFKTKMNQEFTSAMITPDELPSLNQKIDMHLRILSGYIYIIDSHLKTVQTNLTSLSLGKGNLSILEEEIALLETNGLKVDIFKDYLEKLSGKKINSRESPTEESFVNTRHGTEIINLISSSHNPNFILGLQHSILEILLGKKLDSFAIDDLKKEIKNFKKLSIKDISDIADLMAEYNLDFTFINSILYGNGVLLRTIPWGDYTEVREKYSHLGKLDQNYYRGGLHLGYRFTYSDTTIFNRNNSSTIPYHFSTPIMHKGKYGTEEFYNEILNETFIPLISKIQGYFTFLGLADLKFSRTESTQMDIYFNKIIAAIDQEISVINSNYSPTQKGLIKKTLKSLFGEKADEIKAELKFKVKTQTLELLKIDINTLKTDYIHFLISNEDYSK
ncbi:MAG: hypothetical protein L6Q37_02635 [Bdellovibrionaceae bacterium]|nr:hypothetical protein [Pseudobdellovibrionaceae bacterium]NUM58131.1 hypothetical protein [Pseudobdellovibrionaceae bacterium]